jgi:hypothetical protein
MCEIFNKPNAPIIKDIDQVKILRKSNKTYQRLQEKYQAEKKKKNFKLEKGQK